MASVLVSPLTLVRSSSNFCCNQLSNLGLSIAYPDTSPYNATLASYWSLQEGDLSPNCIFVPKTSQDVNTAVSTLSKSPECQFAVKGHGHAPAAGFANIQNGITIDLTFLTEISVNEDHTIVSIGTGASWLDVYQFLDPLGVQVAGGRNGGVGVSGLMLGGGISYFAPRVGWACDNVANFEIVLSSGELTNANLTSNLDLFRALKGGAGNFGIVTRMDIQTFPQGQILAGDITNPIAEREAAFEAFSNITDAPIYDVYASLVMGLTFNATSKAWGLSTTAVYTKPETNPQTFERYESIPGSTSNLAITNLSTYANEAAIPQFDWLFFTGTYGISTELLSKTFDILNETLYDFNVPGGLFWSIAFEPLPTAITQYGTKNGGDSLGVSPADGNSYIMLLSPFWTTASSDSLVHQTASNVIREVASAAKEMGLLKRFQYINYADPSQHPFESYGQQNLENLRVASAKYDPIRMFQKQVPGGFKLWP